MICRKQFKVKRYNGDRIAVRFLHEKYDRTHLLLVIPGGPGISNQYLESFVLKVRKPERWNMALIDLPNHDSSGKFHGMNYSQCLNELAECLSTVSVEYDVVELWGHSFGARLAIDLLVNSDLTIHRATLTGCPVEFSSSNRFIERLSELGADRLPFATNAEFARFWRTALPAYFFRAPTESEIEVLLQGLVVEDSHAMLFGAEKLHGHYLERTSKKLDIQTLQGENDLVLPEGNDRYLTDVLNLKVKRYPACGHFLSIEKPKELAEDLESFHWSGEI